MISAIRRRLRTTDDGSVAVEAAFIIPILILIVFGVVEFSIVLRNNAALAGATRAGARVASAEPRIATFSTDAAKAVMESGVSMPVGEIEEIWIFRAGNNGYPYGQSSFSNCGASCARFIVRDDKPVKVADAYPATSINACPGSMHNVGVYIKAKHNFVTGLFGANMTLTNDAAAKFEPIPTSREDLDYTCR